MVQSPQSEPRAAAVLVAAGRSTRMAVIDEESSYAEGSPTVRKPLLRVEGRPIIEHTCSAFQLARTIAEIVLVAHPDDVETLQRWSAEMPALSKVRAVVPGGESRADSVRIGTMWCSFDVDVICVHDAARPLVSPDLIDEAVRKAAERGAALVALPVRDTIKVVADGAEARETVDRSKLWSAQTPQAFAAPRFRDILKQAQQDAFRPTDDAALWEHYVGAVPIVEGDPLNFKVTTPGDLELLRALLRSRRNGRTDAF